MRNYQCETCGVEIRLEPAEVHQHGAFCGEHMLDQLPALKALADEASAQEKRPGAPYPETNRTAAESVTHEGAPDMSHDTASTPDPFFTPGQQTRITSGYTDPVDGEYYPGERLDLLSALVFGTEACEGIGTAQVYAITDDDGEKSSAIKLTFVDEMKHTAELTLEPEELQNIADWLQDQAQKVTGGWKSA